MQHHIIWAGLSRSVGPIWLTASCAEQAAAASRTATTYCLCIIAARVGLGARLAWCFPDCKFWPQLRDGRVRTACNMYRPLRRRSGYLKATLVTSSLP